MTITYGNYNLLSKKFNANSMSKQILRISLFPPLTNNLRWLKIYKNVFYINDFNVVENIKIAFSMLSFRKLFYIFFGKA
jgi:hypothetical protein